MKLNQGKLIILLIFGVSIAGAVFAIWFQNQTMGRAHQFWESKNAFALRNAPQVEAVKFAPEAIDIPPANLTFWKIGDDTLPVLKRRDISQARGLIHFRAALMLDDNFRFDNARSSPVRWDYAVTLADDERRIVLLFDLSGQRARLVTPEDGGHAASDPNFSRDADISPFSAGLRKFLDEQFVEPKGP